MYLHALFSTQRIHSLMDLGTPVHPVESALCHLTEALTPLPHHDQTCYFARASWFPPLCVAVVEFPNSPTTAEWRIVHEIVCGSLLQKTFRVSQDHVLDTELLRALRGILARTFTLARA